MNVFIKIVSLIAYVAGVMLSVSPFIGRFIIYPSAELYMAHNMFFIELMFCGMVILFLLSTMFMIVVARR
jgi:hypothetical protein